MLSIIMQYFQLFPNEEDNSSLHLFENGSETGLKQGEHSLEAALMVSSQLKNSLQNLAMSLFGKGKLINSDKRVHIQS